MTTDPVQRVIRAAAEVSGRDPGGLDPDLPWTELGFDSLVLFELLLLLEDELGIDIELEPDEEPATLRQVGALIAGRVSG